MRDGGGVTVRPVERTILIVDDDPALLELAAAALEPLGCSVRTAADAASALDALADGRPALLVLDLRLPGMPGLELLERVSRSPSLTGLPVLVVTAWAQREMLDRARALGAAAVMTKPYSPAELRDTAAALMDGA